MLRVWLIDGGARQSDPGDCDDDDLQCGMILFLSRCEQQFSSVRKGNVSQLVIRRLTSYNGKIG